MGINTVEYSNLENWLTEQNSNTSETAYVVKITEIPEDFVSTIATKLLTRNDVYLDLSSTELPSVTNMTDCFYNCKALTKAPVIPNSVTNMYGCFYGCTSLLEAPAIPDSVTNMKDCFYNCTSLTEAPVIPNSVTNMIQCFSSCKALTEAPVIPNSVTNMFGCFGSCTSLTKAPVIGNSVTDIAWCFSYCTSLTEAPVIPDSVTNMRYCFSDCTSLVDAPIIPNSVTNMEYCFRDCTSLTEVYVYVNNSLNLTNAFLRSGVTTIYADNIELIKSKIGEDASKYIYNHLVLYDNLETWLAGQSSNTKDTAYILKITDIPKDFVSTIATKLKTREDVFLDLSNTELPSVANMTECFYKCETLTKAPVIGNRVYNMSSCFKYCASLTEAPVIPDSVTEMYSCFSYCSSLTETPVFPNSVHGMRYCFFYCTSLVEAPAIPNSVTRMHGCFRGCTSLTEAPVIPDSITDMTQCFSNCEALTEAPVIPNSVTNMTQCFSNCEALTEAPVIPNSVTSLASCFSGCTSLVEVPVIPNSVTNLYFCFNNCSSLESINDWRLTDLSNVNTTNVFPGCTSLKNIYIKKNIQQLEKYSLCQVNVKDSEVEYSFIDSDFTNEVTGVIEDVVHTLHIDGLIDEFIIGQSGSITWELAKKALESKTQFSNLDKDFSPNDPHMVIWAKDKSKVKTNIIENALAGEDSTTELNDTDSLIVVQDGEAKKVGFENVINNLTSQFCFLKKTDFFIQDIQSKTYKLIPGRAYLFINVHVLNMGDVVLLTYCSKLDMYTAKVIATAQNPINIQYTAGNDGLVTFHSYTNCRGYLYEIGPEDVTST